MNIIETPLPGVLLLEPKVFGDARGFFMESWNRQTFAALGLDLDFVQDNHSRSARGVLRGLHYQLNEPQGKLVRVVSGAVFDVAVDVRKSSPHFGQWVGYELSADNQRMMWIPPGFAHGFLVLSDSADFLYKTTTYYAPQWDRGIRWDDPQVGVAWPLDGVPVLSAKDQVQPLLKDAEVYGFANQNALQPDPLYQDYLRIAKGGLAVDVPNGKYHVWLNVNRPVLYWGEVQQWSQRTIKANGKVELRAPARVEGNIETPTLVIEEGVLFNGNLIMKRNEAVAREGEKPEAKK